MGGSIGYIVHVELDGADADDYAQLHERMCSEGFSKTLPSSDGTEEALPAAEYYFEGPRHQGAKVMARAQQAASFFSGGVAVVTTEARSISTSGLQDSHSIRWFSRRSH